MQADTAALKALADMTGIFADTLNVVSEDAGWMSVVVDKAHVGMVRFRLDASAFGGTYEKTEGFCVDMVKFAAALKDMGASTEVAVTAGERVTLKSEGTLRRMTQTVDSDSRPNFPADRLNLEKFAIFDPSEVKARMASLCTIGTTVCVTISDEGIVFSSEDETDGMEVSVPMEKCKAVSGPAKAKYPSEYFARIFKAVPKGAALQVSLETDMPVLLKFTTDQYSAEYLVAPQIESE